MRSRDVPARHRGASPCDDCRRARRLRPAQGVRLRLGRPDRDGVDLERRDGLQASAVAERGADAADHGDDRGLALPRRLVADGEDARAAELDRFGALTDRACHLPGALVRIDRLLPAPGVHAGHPRPRRQHLVPGLPAPRRAAGQGQVRAEAVRQPRRPARLLERDRDPVRLLDAPDPRLPRQRQLAHPPVRDRGLHRLHAGAGRDGSPLVPPPRRKVEAEGDPQRRRRGGDRRS